MYIGEATHKGKLIMVSRDEHGKFFISVNGQRVGIKLNATEMCRWFLNVMHEEVVNQSVYKTSDEELKINATKIYRDEGIISAIKYVRIHRYFGLKEAKDYVEALR